MVTVLVPIAIFGVLVMLVVAFFQRNREGIDLSPRGLIRAYLYLASLSGVIVFAIGLASLVTVLLAGIGGLEFAYGHSPRPVPPPGAPDRPFESPDLERRRNEDTIRGLTFVFFGLLFWGAHWLARRGIAGPLDATSSLRRSYLMLGTIMFGLATIILLPTGVYQGLANALVPSTPNQFQPGVGDSLAGGLAALPIWFLYLWLVVRDFRAARAASPSTA